MSQEEAAGLTLPSAPLLPAKALTREKGPGRQLGENEAVIL
jgi:hypothetical protein